MKPLSATSADDLSKASVADLLRVFGAILRELAERKIVRTSNPPAGDYAEYLVSQALGGALAPNSEKSWDVIAPGSRRIQVKGRVMANTNKPGQRQLSVLRSFDFDELAVVLFEPDYSVRYAGLIPVEIAKEKATYRAHVNGYVLFATDNLLRDRRVVDITDTLRRFTTDSVPANIQAGSADDEIEEIPGPLGLDVITNPLDLPVDQIVNQRVLCPGCGTKVFEMWPEGWDAHAAHRCSGARGATQTERKEDFKGRFGHLFR